MWWNIIGDLIFFSLATIVGIAIGKISTIRKEKQKSIGNLVIVEDQDDPPYIFLELKANVDTINDFSAVQLGVRRIKNNLSYEKKFHH